MNWYYKLQELNIGITNYWNSTLLLKPIFRSDKTHYFCKKKKKKDIRMFLNQPHVVVSSYVKVI